MKIYVRTEKSSPLKVRQKLAGTTVMVKLWRHRHIIDSVSVYLNGKGDSATALRPFCRIMVQTIHGGMICATSTRSTLTLALARALKDVGQDLHDIFRQLPSTNRRLNDLFSAPNSRPAFAPVRIRPRQESRS